MKIEPWRHAYNLLGKRVRRLLPHFQELHINMKKGDVRIALQAYVAFMFLTSIIVFAVSMAVLPLLLPYAFHFALISVENFVFSLLLAFFFSILTLILFYVYPGIKASNRRVPIDSNLPYIGSFLALLSSSNVPPKTIFASVSKIDTLKEVKPEFSSIVRDVEVFGQDLMTSIVENARLTPHDKLREMLNGYVATIRTGGNPTEYLQATTENVMREKILKLDLMLESLAALAEIYIMVMVAMPLLFVVLFATLGMLGGGGGALNPAFMVYLLAYVGIPILAAILMVIVSTFET